ncbi:hypothetical protein C500_08207 [Natrialba magadii ATCC 43099]|nr:hypothetical protein C500_08207 [Natrialba magadii ATCC 43099]
MLSRPCGEFGHLGFYLLDIDGIQEGFNIDIMSIDSKWKDHTLGFNVPEKGLPTDSSPARFIEQKRIEYNTEDLINELANKENDDFVDQESFRIQADEDAGNIHEIRTVSDDLEGNCEESNMEYWMGVSADDATAYDYDEIGFSQSNRWRFWVFFSERPDDVFPDSCDPANFIHPSNYSLHVEPHDENHYNDLYFSHPEPDDGDGESGNDEVGLALDIIGAAGGRLTEIGASIADYVMAGSGSSTEVNYEQGGAIYNFDVDLDGEYDDLPRELSNEAQTTQFSLRVHNELHPDDSPYLVSFHPQYTFHYADSNSCDCFHAMPIAAYKTIGPNIAWSALYESVHVD